MGGAAKVVTIHPKYRTNTYMAYHTPITTYKRDESKFNENNKNYDLVYILKRSEKNQDLKMSLRSVAKYCTFRNIWIIGYKPAWVKHVKFIPTVQNADKWKNSITNYTAACKCKDISDNFILMNDDFFALKPIYDWKTNLNVCLGTLENEIEKYSSIERRSRWQHGFEYAVDLLNELNCERHVDYETHLPIIINKNNFLKMLSNPKIIEFMNTNKVLHKRSVYKNLYFDEDLDEPRIIKDVKITLNFDLTDKWLNEDWLSVFDNVVGNTKQYPKVNQYLASQFPKKCIYEA